MEMRPSRACFTAVTLFLVSLTVQTFGELVLLRHEYLKDSPNHLTCISEDENGAALIWNYNVTRVPKRRTIEGFTPRRNESGTVKCSVRTATKCLAEWGKTTEWEVENSARKSMGPIFDHRWEDLQEFGFKGRDKFQDYQEVGTVEGSPGSIWFSARGEQDVQIHMCEHRNSTAHGPCIYVMIAAFGGGKSVIKSCLGGLPKTLRNVSEKYKEDCPYMGAAVERDVKTVMDPYDWRTFRIDWDSDKGVIKVFNNSELSKAFLTGKNENIKLPKKLWVTIRGDASARVRFHLYEFYYTEKKNAVISTKQFPHSGNTFHAELMVSLCRECKLRIDLFDQDNRIQRWTASAKELPSWKLLNLTTTLDDGDPRNFRFQIESILDGNGKTARWAIDTFRIYESGDKTRRSNLTLKREDERVTCQKLSYDGSIETVDSESWLLHPNEAHSGDPHPANIPPFLELREFIRRYEEPDIGRNGFMCNRNGCTCGRGFFGFHCQDECPRGSYGYKCAQSCGSCQDFEECDKKTGFCPGKCQDHKIPPLCKKELEAPTLDNIGDETVTVIQEIDPDGGIVEIVEVYLEEQPKTKDEQTKYSIAEEKIRGDALIFESKVTSLKFGTVYAVHTLVHGTFGNQSLMDSPQRKFATTCHGKTKFEVAPGERYLTVRSWNEDCLIEPYAEEDYEITISSTFANTIQTKRASFGSVPFMMPDLEPATNYSVRIRDKKADYEWDLPDIRTFESAPSEVEELQEAKSTNTTVTIRWKRPSDPGGTITHYVVTIMLKVLKGCFESGEETPHEEATEFNVTTTWITFEDLHPYAKYLVNVRAYNSKEGSPKGIRIETQPNDLPTSKVRNLRFNKTTSFVEWDYPNCTTVTGQTMAHSMFMKRKGATDWNPEWSRRTKADTVLHYDLHEFHLNPFEEYTVRVYVVRDYDGVRTKDSPYEEIDFKSNPAAPSAVRNLTMYDTDPVKNTVSLRWMPPLPANGELQDYMISVKDTHERNHSRIETNGRGDVDCNFQEDCLSYKNLKLPSEVEADDLIVEVFAQNKDVDEIGKPTSLRLRRDIFDRAPHKPVDLEVYGSQTPGVMKLQWRRPWWSPSKISSYFITATFVQSYLLDETVSREPIHQELVVTYPVTVFYTQELSLLPSTVYDVSIAAFNQRLISSGNAYFGRFRVQDSIGFDGELQLRQESESSIEVKIPRILNATKNTFATIKIEGVRTCDHDRSQKSLLKDQHSWGSMGLKVHDTIEQVLYLSGSSSTDKLSNCSLRMGETYTVSIHVMDKTTGRSGPSSKISSEITLINEKPKKSIDLAWLVVVPILVILVLILFVVKYRKRDKCPLIDPAKSGSNTSIPWELKETPVPKPGPGPRHRPDVIPCQTTRCHPLSNPVGIEDFEEYTKDGLKSGLLSSQYRKFPQGVTKECKHGKGTENAWKNRWVNLTAYDETRVVLKTLSDDPHSDYINANWIPGYQNERAYIATQGPKPETVNDFWRMIWQEKVRVICMLANVMEHGKTKCAQYWPEAGEKIQYGGILVTHVTQVVYIDYTIRTFGLTFKRKQREVTHLHYTGWPDHGVPMFTQSVVPYLKKLQSTATGDEPIVVHCSAGVGRTGTLILCDNSLRQAKSQMMVDLAAMTGRMRECRARMVDSEQQYVFAHLAVVEYMLSEQTEIPCNEYSTGRINETRKLLIPHIKRVRNIMWGERVMQSIDEPTVPLPEDVVRDEIAELDLADPSIGLFGPIERSRVNRNHMQTVSIDGFKIENQFLATWLPSPSTRSKVWELIADDNIELVIVLQTPDERDPTCCDLMPSESNPVSSRSLLVEFKGCLEEDEDCRIDKVLVTKTSEMMEDPQSVTVITCRGWGRGLDGKPPPVGALVTLWMASEKVSRSESPTLVLCHDGVMGCGMYVALSFLLERIAVEKECDVICAVRKVRRSKPGFGQSIEQFEYLYDAALNYVDRFKLYSNYS